MRIQHNIMALNAYRQLGGNNNALSKNLEKLSSGYRINRAGDDAAGLAISEKMRAQIKGLEAAQKNANDGISLVQTAEGALTEVHSMLNRMVYLATQSANGTYDNDVDRANLDKEVQTLKEEIDRISKSTNFNGLNLLDGSMDGDATKTTGGKTDVPILQDVATNPTLEVGTKTVLHKDNPEAAETEINVELHNVNITKKALAGDSLKFKVGDAEVELKIMDKTDPAFATTAGALEAGQSYDSKEIAQKIADAFLAGDKLIGGQEFGVTVGATGNGGKLTFTQKTEPGDPTEVVNANVDVKLDYVSNPNGNPVEYTAKIKADALTTGNKITIGGDQLTLGDGVLQGKTTLEEAFGGDGIETDSGYKVQYNATEGTLTITDPNGTLGAPAVKFDDYATPLKVSSDITKGADATAASGEFTVAGMRATGAKNGDQLQVSNGVTTVTFTHDGAKWTGNTDDFALEDLGGGKFKVTTKAIGDAANVDLPATTGVVYTPAADTQANLDFTGGIDADAANGIAEVKASAQFTLGSTVTDDTEIALGADKWVYDAATGNWDADGANSGDYTLTVADGVATFTSTKTGDAGNTAAGTGPKIDVTYEPTDNGANAVTMAGGADATGANVVFDLSNVNMKNGDKLIFTDADGARKEAIWDTDLATTLGNAGIDATNLTGAGNLGAGVTATVTGNKITLTNATTGAASPIPTFKIETAKRQDKTAEVKTPANADSMTGTWNVQSTQNKQGAAANGGQLASTTFDLTADMVKDGNTLTIGKETYVFKVGPDSTTKAAPGQTIIDLSAFKDGDADLIDAAGAALANETGNKAFTIGYAGNGKISIHEKEGQTQYNNGELESVEEFDKLVYMNSPEVTETTGRGLTLQVGDTADDFQKVELNIRDMSTDGLGIADITIGTIDDATSAIAKIKEAINTVSAQRGDLGAVQNRLEHTINNLGVQAENITAAESRIRDTDMAEEMMAYTKNNILVQAAQAMLAQANQVPQGILQLLQ